MLTSNKIEKFILLCVMFFVLFVSIFSFSLVKKAEAQPIVCPQGYTINMNVYPNQCMLTNLYNSLYPSVTVTPAAINPDSNGTYTPLAKLPGFEKPFDFTDTCPLGRYLNITINLVIGLVAVMAMVMIVMGGLEYITSELISSKASGKDKIMNAVVGLLIALSSYLILNTLNPNLLNLCLDGIPKAQITIDPIGDSASGPFTPLSDQKLRDLGVHCPGSGGTAQLTKIAESFSGKVKYSQDPRNSVQGNTIYTDCSAFVAQVYKCAGLNLPGGTTASMFNASNAVSKSTVSSSNFQRTLTAGDLLGWKQGQSSTYTAGHVVMYMGGGKFIEVNGKNGVQIRNLSDYTSSYNHVIKAP